MQICSVHRPESSLSVSVNKLFDPSRGEVFRIFEENGLIEPTEANSGKAVPTSNINLNKLFQEIYSSGCISHRSKSEWRSDFELHTIRDIHNVEQSSLSASDIALLLDTCAAKLAQEAKVSEAVNPKINFSNVNRGRNHRTEVLWVNSENWSSGSLKLAAKTKSEELQKDASRRELSVTEINFASNLSPSGIFVTDQFLHFNSTILLCYPHQKTSGGCSCFYTAPVILTILKKFNQKGGAVRFSITQMIAADKAQVSLSICLSTGLVMQGDALSNVSAINLRSCLEDQETLAVGGKSVNSDTLATVCMDALLLLIFCLYEYSRKPPTGVFSLREGFF